MVVENNEAKLICGLFLKAEDSIFSMIERIEVRFATSVKHDRGTAHEVPCVVASWVEMLLEKSLVDESCRVFPILGPSVAENVMDLES